MSAPLSDHEIDVLTVFGLGATTQAAARGFGTTQWQVEAALATAAVKLGTTDRAGMVGRAILTGQLVVEPTGEPVPDKFSRELFDVLVLVARGKPNAEIATELVLSRHSVKSRLWRLSAALGALSRPHAVVRGFECGVLRRVPVHERVSS